LNLQLVWEQVYGAQYYIVTTYDAYSGRSLGVQYRVQGNTLAIAGLPLGTDVEVVVQVRRHTRSFVDERFHILDWFELVN
jgi:hypothetical protein